MPHKQRNGHTIGLRRIAGVAHGSPANLSFDFNHKTIVTAGFAESLDDENIHRKGYADCSHWYSRPTSVVSYTSSNYTYAHDPVGFTVLDMGVECYSAFGPTSLWAANQWIGTELWSQSAMAKAMWKMRKSYQPRLSVINFLLELKDLRSIFKFWSQAGHLRKLAAAKLETDFGVGQFLRDVQTILNGLSTFRQQLKSLLKKLGTVEKRHFRTKIRNAGERAYILYDQTEASELSLINNYIDESQRPVLSENPVIPPQFGVRRAERMAVLLKDQWANYTMRCSYIAPGLSEDQALIRDFLDYFGVRWDPSIIWNAVKWTFIIDWFVDVGKFLSRMYAKPWYDVYFRVHDLCVGTKLEVQGSSYYTWARDNTLPVVTDRKVISDYGKLYKRRAVIPSEEDLVAVGFSWPELQKYVLGASLLVTNTKRGKTKRAPRKQVELEWFWRRLKKRRRNRKWLQDGGDDRRRKQQPQVAR
jgi:hypothetical protein